MCCKKNKKQKRVQQYQKKIWVSKCKILKQKKMMIRKSHQSMNQVISAQIVWDNQMAHAHAMPPIS